MEDLRQYTVFLQRVVDDGGNMEETKNMGIEGLRGRFINLKSENKQLNDRKSAINSRIEQVKEDERRDVAAMTAELYEKQKIMNDLQTDIEEI